VVLHFDLVIVDLDGTLVDSEALLVGLVNDTLIAHGHAPAPAPTVAAAIGLPLDEVFRRAAPTAHLRAIEAFCADYRRHADAMAFVRQFRPFADVATTLEDLNARAVRVVVATSKGRATTLDILAHCAVRHCIDEVIGGDSVTHGKPHREMVDCARRLFPAAPQRTIVVGDTSFDIEMGKSAGVATCAVTYGTHSAALLQALQPDFVIDRFAALRELIVARSDPST
jgi:HAD superfamily hydrolase (TIGR01509 family)